MLRNTRTSYGWLSRLLHGSMAILLTVLFVMGLYMTSLGYYDPLYHSLPWWHKSLGLLTLFLLLIRVVWLRFNQHPKPLVTHKKWEQALARLIQRCFYGLILFIGISGYFIATAKGKGIAFFDVIEIPAIIKAVKEDYVDLIGDAHEIMAISLVVLVVLHVLAALKHHFIDQDKTLTRMLLTPQHKHNRNKL